MDNMNKNLSWLEYIVSYLYGVQDNIISFMQFKKIFKNYLPVIFKLKTNHFPINAILKDKSKIEFKKPYQCHNFVVGKIHNVKYDIKNDYFEDVPAIGYKLFVGDGNGSPEAILMGDYKNLDVKNKTIIDIGANIGDTALLFAVLNAK